MTPFLGQLALAGFSYAPKGWALCNGQLLPINQNQALFSLLGTTYGGNGQTTFGLPNMQGRVALSAGTGDGVTFTLGQVAGEESHTLQTAEMPIHAHTLNASSTAGGILTTPNGNTVGPSPNGNANNKPFASSGNSTMSAAALSSAGSNSAHENRSPYLVLNYIIALQGIFPSRN